MPRKAKAVQPALPLGNLGSVGVSVSLPVVLVAALSEKAAVDGVSRSDAFRLAVTAWVNG